MRLDYGNWVSIGSLKDIVTEIQIQPLTAFVFEFRITDSITGSQIKLRGLIFLMFLLIRNNMFTKDILMNKGKSIFKELYIFVLNIKSRKTRFKGLTPWNKKKLV